MSELDPFLAKRELEVGGTITRIIHRLSIAISIPNNGMPTGPITVGEVSQKIEQFG